MNCPFCAEEIKDEAVVCKHCGRDLHFILVISRSLAEFREQLRNLDRRVAILEVRGMSTVDMHKRELWGGWISILLAALVTATATATATYWWWEVSEVLSETLLLLVALFSAPLAGLALAIAGHRHRVAAGIWIGVGGGVAYLVADYVQDGVVLIEVLGGMAIYVTATVSAAAFGGWVSDRFLRKRVNPLQAHVRELITKGRDPQVNNDDIMERIARFAELMTPIITAIVPLLLMLAQWMQTGVERGTPP